MDEHKDTLSWKLLSAEEVRKDEWIDFRSGKYELPNGKVISPFYTYRKCNFAVIVAVTEEGEYLCVRQYRPGVEKVLTEFPAGAVEPGEDPEKAARRELKEETGFESEDWVRLGKIAPNATIADNMAYCYLARDCRKAGERHLDETECVDMLLLTKKQIEGLIARDEFVQAVHVAAYYMAEAKNQAE